MKNPILKFSVTPYIMLIGILLISNTTFSQESSKKKHEFKVFAGFNLSDMSSEDGTYSASVAPGYALGAKYKRGKFFYWELGAIYNKGVYNLTMTDETGTNDNLGVSNIGIPINVGINLLSATDKVVGLRFFVGVSPTFVLGTNDNDFDISTEELNNYLTYGKAGLGIDITVIFIETGINYGFSDLFETTGKTNPYEYFLNLGVRF
jgi:hypothetical protein